MRTTIVQPAILGYPRTYEGAWFDIDDDHAILYILDRIEKDFVARIEEADVATWTLPYVPA